MRKSRGFTLVELLVVIGIIAVLISILLPSLAKAKQYANSLACMANIRSVGQALQFYANDHKGKLPYSAYGEWENIWVGQVSTLLGAKIGGVDWNYSKTLKCIDAGTEATTDWGPTHYTANHRAMPYNNFGWWKTLKPYPLATKKSAEKMLLWDGALFPGWGHQAVITNSNQANLMTWFEFSDPVVGEWRNLSDLAPISANTWYRNTNPGAADWIGKDNHDQGVNDNPWSWSEVTNMRYRHLGNTSLNVLFFDGHVESRKLGTVTFGDLCIYPYNN
jgi:prepilin-type N-terminal cleavage/methylation domain-containing protein/prepilin-type processing-associated H-X9-DG protein